MGNSNDYEVINFFDSFLLLMLEIINWVIKLYMVC